MLFVHSGYVDLRLQIGKVKLLRERWNVLERKDLSRSIDAFLGLVRRYFNLSLHKVYSCIIVIRADICLARCKAANDSLICLCKLQNLTQLSIVFLRLPSQSMPDEVISFLQKCKFPSVKLSTCCAMEKIKTQDNWKSINGLRMTFHIVQFLFFSYLLISRNMVTIIKKITLDMNSL